MEQGREENNSPPSLDVIGKHFETTNVSAQQIEQQVERVTQNIANQLMDHVNPQVGWFEATVSKNTKLNDEGQNRKIHDRYCTVQVTQDILEFLNKWMGFHSKPPKLSLLVGRKCPGSMRLVLIDDSLK